MVNDRKAIQTNLMSLVWWGLVMLPADGLRRSQFISSHFLCYHYRCFSCCIMLANWSRQMFINVWCAQKLHTSSCLNSHFTGFQRVALFLKKSIYGLSRRCAEDSFASAARASLTVSVKCWADTVLFTAMDTSCADSICGVRKWVINVESASMWKLYLDALGVLLIKRAYIESICSVHLPPGRD